MDTIVGRQLTPLSVLSLTAYMEGGQAEQRTAQPLLQVLPLVWDKSSLDDWKDSAAECVRGNIFAKQQFLASDACLDMGGYIQRHVTNFINVSSETRIRQFWEEKGGRETVRNTFRRKRQAAQNAMKIAFKGRKKRKNG